MNFFQHETLLSTTRVECKEHGVKTVAVPWSQSGSGFSLLFELMVMILAREMPVESVARIVGKNGPRIWRVIEHYVG